MKKFKNKKVLTLGTVFGGMLLVPLFVVAGMVLSHSAVSAGGTSDGEGNVVAALCYYGGTINRGDWVGIQSEREACVSSGGTIVEPNQPSPLRFCYLGSEFRNIGSDGTCTDGAIVEVGQPVPAVLKADGTINNDTNPNSKSAPVPITSAKRDELANCDKGPEKCLKENPIMLWTLYIINFLSAGVAVVVTVMIIVGGVQYAAAGPNPQAVQAAKKRIMNAIIAFVAYFFLFAFLQWLVPGGLF